MISDEYGNEHYEAPDEQPAPIPAPPSTSSDNKCIRCQIPMDNHGLIHWPKTIICPADFSDVIWGLGKQPGLHFSPDFSFLDDNPDN